LYKELLILCHKVDDEDKLLSDSVLSLFAKNRQK